MKGEFGIWLGTAATLLTIVGILVKVVLDYAKVKEKTSANEKYITSTKTSLEKNIAEVKNNYEKECKDIRIDLGKDILNIDNKFSQEIKSLREDMKEEREYTHESFVKLTNNQTELSNILKEVTITLRSFETSIDQRLSSLERKIDSITTIKVNKEA